MYKIIWSPSANIELLKALEFSIKVNNSNTYAIKIVEELKHIESLLIDNAFLGSNTEFTDIRKCVVLKNYSIFYSIDEENKEINVVFFWDNRQDPKELKQILS